MPVGEKGIWLLDTNVLSELVAPKAAPQVIDWLSSQADESIYTTAINEAEAFYGVERMPAGRRREGLRSALEAVFAGLRGRVLPFDTLAARRYARLMAQRAGAGRVMSQSDAQIAAIAEEHQATLVTRNVRDFTGCGVDLWNPWSA